MYTVFNKVHLNSWSVKHLKNYLVSRNVACRTINFCCAALTTFLIMISFCKLLYIDCVIIVLSHSILWCCHAGRVRSLHIPYFGVATLVELVHLIVFYHQDLAFSFV